MDQAFGLENVMWFADAPEGTHEDPTFERNRLFGCVAQAVEAVQNAVGGIEIANLAKHEIIGLGAREWPNKTMASFIPNPSRISLTPMIKG